MNGTVMPEGWMAIHEDEFQANWKMLSEGDFPASYVLPISKALNVNPLGIVSGTE